MVSSLSPIVSNLLLNMLKKKLVKKFLDEGIVKFWKRYADDVLCIVSKDALENILTRLNNWDPQLVFTVTEMAENSLVFSESEIYISENKVNFKLFRRFGQKTVLSNFLQSEMSKKYLKANIITQCNNLLDACLRGYWSLA